MLNICEFNYRNRNSPQKYTLKIYVLLFYLEKQDWNWLIAIAMSGIKVCVCVCMHIMYVQACMYIIRVYERMNYSQACISSECPLSISYDIQSPHHVRLLPN